MKLRRRSFRAAAGWWVRSEQIPHDVKQPLSFPRRVFAPGVCTFASPTRIEGWAERRETFGCCAQHPLGVPSARHKTRVNALMTRHTRRLRGALRPMTRRTAGGNNLTISRHRGVSVPIVSQTEIDLMKTALSLMLALATATALTEPPPVPKPPGLGGIARLYPVGLVLHPVAGCFGRYEGLTHRLRQTLRTTGRRGGVSVLTPWRLDGLTLARATGSKTRGPELFLCLPNGPRYRLPPAP